MKACLPACLPGSIGLRLASTCSGVIIRVVKTKLTLTVDEDAVSKVKLLAKRKGVSVSSLFEQWSLRMAANEDRPSLGSRLRGKWKTGATGERDPRLDYLLDKHVK